LAGTIIIRFQPRAITEALEEIRSRHPDQEEKSGPPPKGVLDEVRQVLLETPHEKLQDIAQGFSPKKLKVCIFLLRDKLVDAKALTVLEQRPRADIFIEAWCLLVRDYPFAPLQRLVKMYAESLGTECLVSSGTAPSYISDWLNAPTIAAGVLGIYRRISGHRAFDVYLEASKLHKDHGLFSGAWHELLTKGTAKDLRVQEGERILGEWLKPTTGANAIVEYGRHYLNTLKEFKNWYEPLLELIAARYGCPARDKGHEDPFWKAVSQEARNAYLQWHISRQILAFFEGERAEFWRYFVDAHYVRGVTDTLDGKGFLLDFGTFGVVEFKDIGNAAYIYPKAVFDVHWSRAKSYINPSELKNRSRTVQSVGQQGRIIHGPRGAWQEQAQNEIERLLRRA
jgi:hypothetical protein